MCSNLKVVSRVLLSLLVLVLLPQVLAEGLQAGPVVAAHAVEVVHARLGKVHDGEAPVHAQVDGHEEQVVGEHVHLAGPPLHGRVALDEAETRGVE